MAATAAPPLFRGFPLHHRLRHHAHRCHVIALITPLRRPSLKPSTESSQSPRSESSQLPRSEASLPSSSLPSSSASSSSSSSGDEVGHVLRAPEPAKQKKVENRGGHCTWRVKEREILRDIGPVLLLAKEILHTDKYMDGQRLNAEHEKVVVEKLLAYHPRYQDKIGCGINSIIVDQHPTFNQTRSLFVVRTDGAWIDFSYQKCLREYIRAKFPAHAAKFIRAHLKRGSGTNTAS